MFSISEQFSSTTKAHLEAQLTFIHALTNNALQGVEKVIEFNIRAAKASLEASSVAAKQLLSTKGPQEFFVLSAALSQPKIGNFLPYSSPLSSLSSGTQVNLFKIKTTNIPISEINQYENKLVQVAEPVIEEAVVTEPVAEVIAVQPTTEAVIDEPVAEVVVVQPTTEAVVDEPVAEVIAVQPTTETVVDEPVAEVIAVQPTTETVVDEPVAEVIAVQPATQAIIDEPVAEAVVVQPVTGTIVDEPVVEAVVINITSGTQASLFKTIHPPITETNQYDNQLVQEADSVIEEIVAKSPAARTIVTKPVQKLTVLSGVSDISGTKTSKRANPTRPSKKAPTRK